MAETKETSEVTQSVTGYGGEVAVKSNSKLWCLIGW